MLNFSFLTGYWPVLITIRLVYTRAILVGHGERGPGPRPLIKWKNLDGRLFKIYNIIFYNILYCFFSFFFFFLGQARPGPEPCSPPPPPPKDGPKLIFRINPWPFHVNPVPERRPRVPSSTGTAAKQFRFVLVFPRTEKRTVAGSPVVWTRRQRHRRRSRHTHHRRCWVSNTARVTGATLHSARPALPRALSRRFVSFFVYVYTYLYRSMYTYKSTSIRP